MSTWPASITTLLVSPWPLVPWGRRGCEEVFKHLVGGDPVHPAALVGHLDGDVHVRLADQHLNTLGSQ